jgi:hypothetical protein
MLPIWWGLRFSARSIQLAGRPDTVVTAAGPRRSTATSPELTPDVAYALAERAHGKEIAWEGSLWRVCRRGAKTYLQFCPFRPSVFGVQIVECFTEAPDFLEDLEGFLKANSPAVRTAEVQVRGTIVARNVPGVRFGPGPLVRIERIERRGDATAAVVAGQPKRKADPFASPSDTLAGLMRDAPAPGTEVAFSAVFQFQTTASAGTGQKVRVNVSSAGNTSEHAFVDFPATAKTLFTDYRSGDPVKVKAVVGPWPDEPWSPLQFAGKSIVREKNQLSLVTDEGRATPALDLSAEEKRWSADKYKDSLVGATFEAAGVFKECRSQAAGLQIAVEKLFFKYDNLDLTCAKEQSLQDFFNKLNKGDEVVFGFKVTGGPSYRRTCALQWIRRIDEPDRRVEANDGSP